GWREGRSCCVGALGRALNVRRVRLARGLPAPPRIWTLLASLPTNRAAMARLILKRGAEHRVSAGHPWIYRTQVADLKGFSEAGLAVEVVDAGGRYLGQGFYNPRPSLCCRLLTRSDEAIDAPFSTRRLEAAWEYRRTAGLVSDAYRLCWSEADGLPGLVVDRYGPVSVVQCLTLGMFKAA